MVTFKSLFRLLVPGGMRLIWSLTGAVLYSSLVCYIDSHAVPSAQIFNASAALSISVVFGLLLIFRNNSAYERWWEGRKLWGQLVNDSRNLAIKLKCTVEPIDRVDLIIASNLMSSFAESLKTHLRLERSGHRLTQLGISDLGQHVPIAIAQRLYRLIAILRQREKISDWERLQLDTHAKALMDICGACERIVKSPISASYKLLLWFGLILNIGCLPWLLAPVFHWLVPLIVLVSGYFLFGLEMLAEEVERPFDDLPNDLPLDAICLTINTSMIEILENEYGT
ncbi:MAG: hypothetical protein J0H83_14035 [Candidatus Melainabacteria bacterium]|nr:hypothetical protein [Candidatus Melainabacteria bacterium]MBX9674433.1 hypothetical protein [Candidatus Obscuribacterales bacterium]